MPRQDDVSWPPDYAVLHIMDMDCAVEENDIRRILSGIGGIRHLECSLPRRQLAIDADEKTVSLCLATIQKAGYRAERIRPGMENTAEPADKKRMWRLGTALGIALVVEIMHLLGPDTRSVMLSGMAMSAVAIWLSGLDTYRKGIAAIARRQLNINALMTVAVTGAFVIGQWPEAAMVMALYAVAELIEARSADRARHAIQRLFDLTPPVADVLRKDGSWVSMPVDTIENDMTVRVRPGERIALDGIVTTGHSTVDQSPVTGESIPVDKRRGDTVFAGTINESGTLAFRVTAASSDTVVARIIRMVEEAQEKRAPIQRFVDRFAAIYTPLVFLFALGVAVLSPLFFGWTWLHAAYKALVMLVIACPCALVIATPVTIVSALAAAARRGILIKGGIHLEQARHLDIVALDKTGTVTEGKPRLVDTVILANRVPRDTVFDRAAALAGNSNHPVSKAIAFGLGRKMTAVSDFADMPGKGVRGVIDGCALILGNHRLIEEAGLCTPDVHALLLQHERQGHTVTILADKEGVLAIFTVADTIRDTAREALAMLRRQKIATAMLTGDNQTTAQGIAREAGIETVFGNLLPDGKQKAVLAWRKQGRKVAMIGDGINDAPALAHADIGIAMGNAGTDIAMEAADVVIMNDDLRRVAQLISLSKTTYIILWQNILIALGIKLVFFALALAGSATMWMAVFADVGASLLVLLNGLRVLRK